MTESSDHPTLDLLHELGLHGTARGFPELTQNPQAGNLQHGEWLAIPLEHEAHLAASEAFPGTRPNGQAATRANVEDIACDSIRQHRNLLVTGPIGIGKNWIAGFGLD